MRFQPLIPWLRGNESITAANFLANNEPCFESGGFIALDLVTELYLADTIDTSYLYESWNKNRKYIQDVYEFLDARKLKDILYLDNEDKYSILEKLGEPPTCCYNLYFITIYNDHTEKLVYIGKTDSKTSRFANGHRAALKLHNPLYSEFKKRIYFGTLIFLSGDKNYIPLEFIDPFKKANKYLDDIEALLIEHFKPELNIKLEKRHYIEDLSVMHIQNLTDKSTFLNDYMLFM